MNRNYWLDLFTGATWNEFQKAGSSVSGFRQSRWNTVQKIAQGDYLLCYLTGVSQFIGILEVVSPPFKEQTRDIWKDDDFPCRFKVKPIIALTPETAIPVMQLREQLSVFQNLKSPHAWTGHFRSSPAKWKLNDGEAIVRALMEAKDNPVKRPVDMKKLNYRPVALRAKMGLVTVPESNAEEPDSLLLPQKKKSNDSAKEPDLLSFEQKRSTDHNEMQWLLLKLGCDMGFDVWVARNDRSKDFNGKKYSDLPRIKNVLPLQFDDATNRTIELIDVLWLRGNAILAAFEIESTTSIYSGLLRMSDLIAMQPNLNIPLYLVAPDDRRDKVMTEVNRPTFSHLKPPLSEMCRFISFSGLKDQINQAAAYIRYLKPEFLGELSESCELEKA